MANLDDANRAVKEYENRYRRTDVPPLEDAGLMDLFPVFADQHGAVTSTWAETWPHNHREGVYLVFCEKRELLYVGRAQRIGRRLYDHFGGAVSGCVPRGKWSSSPRYVKVIAVPDEMFFEAGALEEYLIACLNPPDNVRGIRS